jgi:hypothetical protein
MSAYDFIGAAADFKREVYRDFHFGLSLDLRETITEFEYLQRRIDAERKYVPREMFSRRWWRAMWRITKLEFKAGIAQNDPTRTRRVMTERGRRRYAVVTGLTS